MATNFLITGATGNNVTSAQDGHLYGESIGNSIYCLGASSFNPALVDANTVTIPASDWLFNGRYIQIPTAQTVTIENGAQSITRKDLICLHYSKKADTGVESVDLAVVKGLTDGTGAYGSYPSASLLNEPSESYAPIAVVTVTGLTPTIETYSNGFSFLASLASVQANIATVTTKVNALPTIQHGTITIAANTVSAGGSSATVITFPKKFSVTPAVWGNSRWAGFIISALNASSTQLVLNVYNKFDIVNPGEVVLDWYAYGDLA